MPGFDEFLGWPALPDAVGPGCISGQDGVERVPVQRCIGQPDHSREEFLVRWWRVSRSRCRGALTSGRCCSSAASRRRPRHRHRHSGPGTRRRTWADSSLETCCNSAPWQAASAAEDEGSDPVDGLRVARRGAARLFHGARRRLRTRQGRGPRLQSRPTWRVRRPACPCALLYPVIPLIQPAPMSPDGPYGQLGHDQHHRRHHDVPRGVRHRARLRPGCERRARVRPQHPAGPSPAAWPPASSISSEPPLAGGSGRRYAALRLS